MLTLKTLLSLPVFLSTTIITHALAAPGKNPDGNDNKNGYIDVDEKDSNLNFAASLTGGEGCKDKDLKYIRDGFNEMTKLFAVANDPDFEHECEIEFFGREERISNYTDLIRGNLQRAAQYGNQQGNGTRNPDIHVRCDDPLQACDFDDGKKDKDKDKQQAAYNIGNEPHINFCKKYFDLDPLDEQINDEQKNEQSKLALINYYNRATLWARMVMHISSIGQAIVMQVTPNLTPNATSEWNLTSTLGPMNTSVLAGVMDDQKETSGPNIRVPKYAYGVTRAKLLATLSTQTDYDALNNAENYALYALARYMIETRGFFPSMPIVTFGNDMAVLTNEQIQDGDKKKYACFLMPDVQPKLDGLVLDAAKISAGMRTVPGLPGHMTGLVWAVVFLLGMNAIS